MNYPDYVYKTLARAREEGQWSSAQADGAALCFDILALFPDCKEASDLVYELFCDEWTIYDNRVALQQNMDEWDDRPWQQRRRLALSFRFMSRWDGRYERQFDRGGPKDVRKILEAGKMELLGAYCLGDEECTDYAWSIFADAIAKANDPRATLFWIGWQYADLGFFADAAEALGELCSRFNDADARRLLAEVVWWRDNAHRIPWIPPAGDGSRYDRMMEMIDPSAPKTKDYIHEARNENQKERIAAYRPSIDGKLAGLFEKSIPAKDESSASTLVDWGFLDRDDGQPGELPDWAKRHIKRLERLEDGDRSAEMIKDMIRMHKYSRNIPPPEKPRKYSPNEPPFDSSEAFGAMGEDWDDDE
ncbi:MAG: hypothetical protein DCC59_13740 [Chloroflexi bacterium]|nr:hypothetical protein [Chloroflexi bacterium CFX1]MCK6567074.1 hypothetical protein [Anaerolineales bacterium]MCQ3954234.1 hypothetical protein [Chloroflexota bacterium]MDL1920791.1 hypothetical protein [Chloroflexi bacterium CFX5]NUQ60454.1 hypothetical protein [Anaerolineales bacterium]